MLCFVFHADYCYIHILVHIGPSNKPTLSFLTSVNGCVPFSKLKILFDQIPDHQNSQITSGVIWNGKSLQLICHLNTDITTAISKGREPLQRVIDAVLLLGERGLFFRKIQMFLAMFIVAIS